MSDRHGVRLELPIATGRTAEVFAWDDGRVVKLFREGWGMDAAEHEAALGRLIYESGAPAPRVDGVVTAEARAGVLYERIEGSSLLAELTARPWRLPAIARSLAETQATMHARRVGPLPALRDVLANRIRHAELLAASERETSLRALDALPDGDALCHGDYHPDNVLVSRSRGPVIIDWENAARGEPLADVARTVLLLRGSVVYPKHPVERTLRRAALALFIPRYLRRYRELRPFDDASLTLWKLPVAAARLSEGVGPEEEFLRTCVRQLIDRRDR